MTDVGQPFTSGDWVVKEGKEQEFIAAWTELADWSMANADGSDSFALIQLDEDPLRFLSFGAWNSPEAVSQWRGDPGFQQRLGACRELCEQFAGRDYRLVVSRERG